MPNDTALDVAACLAGFPRCILCDARGYVYGDDIDDNDCGTNTYVCPACGGPGYALPPEAVVDPETTNSCGIAQ